MVSVCVCTCPVYTQECVTWNAACVACPQTDSLNGSCVACPQIDSVNGPCVRACPILHPKKGNGPRLAWPQTYSENGPCVCPIYIQQKMNGPCVACPQTESGISCLGRIRSRPLLSRSIYKRPWPWEVNVPASVVLFTYWLTHFIDTTHVYPSHLLIITWPEFNRHVSCSVMPAHPNPYTLFLPWCLLISRNTHYIWLANAVDETMGTCDIAFHLISVRSWIKFFLWHEFCKSGRHFRSKRRRNIFAELRIFD